MGGRKDTDAELQEFSGGQSAGLCCMDCSRVREPVATAFGLEDGIGQPLTAAWLELDACRSALGGTDHPAILGHLELVASLLREAVFNLLLTTAKCLPATAYERAMQRPLGKDCRSGNDTKCHPGVGFPMGQRLRDHGPVKEHRSMPGARAAAH